MCDPGCLLTHPRVKAFGVTHTTALGMVPDTWRVLSTQAAEEWACPVCGTCQQHACRLPGHTASTSFPQQPEGAGQPKLALTWGTPLPATAVGAPAGASHFLAPADLCPPLFTMKLATVRLPPPAVWSHDHGFTNWQEEGVKILYLQKGSPHSVRVRPPDNPGPLRMNYCSHFTGDKAGTPTQQGTCQLSPKPAGLPLGFSDGGKGTLYGWGSEQLGS